MFFTQSFSRKHVRLTLFEGGHLFWKKGGMFGWRNSSKHQPKQTDQGFQTRRFYSETSSMYEYRLLAVSAWF
jgi:hypothetical protein